MANPYAAVSSATSAKIVHRRICATANIQPPIATTASLSMLASTGPSTYPHPALVTGAPGVGVINASFSQIEKYLAGLLPP